VSFTRWGAGRWRHDVTKKFGAKVKAMNIDKPPYSERYPELAELFQNIDVNHVWRNVILRCGPSFRNDGGIQDTAANHVTKANPGFVDPAKGDFRLKSGAGLPEKIGFRPIPFAEIGTYP
jgi:hypothetical protein